MEPTTDNETLWQTALGEFEVSLSKANYTTWFKGSFIADITDDLATIGIPNNFSKEWLRKKFDQQITQTLHKLTNGRVERVEYIIANKKALSNQPPSSPLIPSPVEKHLDPVKAARPKLLGLKLNPIYTFEHFIVGGSNSLAHAASEAVAENPGHAYNPLFLYGGVGLGKTHLIQAIAHRVLESDPDKVIAYISCEQFTNDFVDALRQGKATEFKHMYREVDLLLIDDIQFIAGKEATQEEFFHTFNALHQHNRQIIITSDRVPKAIPTLEERLSSRFEWGLIVDINLPDVETRAAIIKSKCEEKKFPLDDKAIAYIAQGIASNIREIEGALNRLIAHCNLHKVSPTEEVIHSTLQQFLTSQTQKSINASKVLKLVAAYFNITLDELIGAKRQKELVHARQIAMHLLRTELNLSFPLIGKEIGGRDHTTIIYACEKIERGVKKDDQLQQEVSILKERLYNTPS